LQMSHGCQVIEIRRLELAVCMVAPPAPVAYDPLPSKISFYMNSYVDKLFGK
jgi:hypothetical protein